MTAAKTKAKAKPRAKATPATLETETSMKAPDADVTEQEKAQTPPADVKAGKPGESRKIEHVTYRGDWLDPFSGKTVYYGEERSAASGAIRDGDHATLPKG